MMNRGMGLALMAAASMAGIAAHTAPVPERRKRRERPEITEEQKKRFLEAQEIARAQATERKTAAERKRMRKAEKLKKLAEKGAIGVKIDTSDIPEATAEQFAKAKVTRKRSPGPIKIAAKPGGGTGTEKKPGSGTETTAGGKKKPAKKPAAAPGKKAPPFPAKKAPVKKK